MAEGAIKLSSKKKSMFIDKVKEILPEGGNLNLCLTCGACSSGCPATGLEGMDPRKFLRMAALGMDEEEANRKGWRGTGAGQFIHIQQGGSTTLNILLCDAAYPTGYSKETDSYIFEKSGKGEDGYYWTGSFDDIYNKAYIRQFANRMSIKRLQSDSQKWFSVRCVKDSE